MADQAIGAPLVLCPEFEITDSRVMMMITTDDSKSTGLSSSRRIVVRERLLVTVHTVRAEITTASRGFDLHLPPSESVDRLSRAQITA